MQLIRNALVDTPPQLIHYFLVETLNDPFPGWENPVSEPALTISARCVALGLAGVRSAAFVRAVISGAASVSYSCMNRGWRAPLQAGKWRVAKRRRQAAVRVVRRSRQQYLACSTTLSSRR